MRSGQAEHCRQKAIECEQEADRDKSPVTAEAWLKLAKQGASWRTKLSVIVLLNELNPYCAGARDSRMGYARWLQAETDMSPFQAGTLTRCPLNRVETPPISISAAFGALESRITRLSVLNFMGA
jgi:hypothetical protein